MKKVIIFISLLALLTNLSCDQNSYQSAPLNYQSDSMANTQINSKADNRQTESKIDLKNYPPVLYGSYMTSDARINSQMSVNVDVRGEDVETTLDRGFTVNLPPVKTTVEMDMVNCFGYLGTAKVTYQGLQHQAWTAELIPETKIADVEKQLLRCVDDPNDEFTRKYLSNSIFFVAPKDEKRKQIQYDKKPDWNLVFERIPFEWLKIAKLPRRNPTKKQIENCIGNWADSDGDGVIDLLSICAVNDENLTEAGSPYEYMRVLQLVNGNWRQLWQTVDTKD
jgi:hypothetical protein